MDIPPEVDAELRRRIHGRFAARRSRRQPRWWGRGVGWAAAAAIVLAVTLVPLARRREAVGPPTAGALARDIDGSGRVDMLDAFALARLLESGGAAASHDVTGDGRVDADDVDAVAAEAVSLARLAEPLTRESAG